jgi:hypothetical protein
MVHLHPPSRYGFGQVPVPFWASAPCLQKWEQGKQGPCGFAKGLRELCGSHPRQPPPSARHPERGCSGINSSLIALTFLVC